MPCLDPAILALFRHKLQAYRRIGPKKRAATQRQQQQYCSRAEPVTQRYCCQSPPRLLLNQLAVTEIFLTVVLREQETSH